MVFINKVKKTRWIDAEGQASGSEKDHVEEAAAANVELD